MLLSGVVAIDGNNKGVFRTNYIHKINTYENPVKKRENKIQQKRTDGCSPFLFSQRRRAQSTLPTEQYSVTFRHSSSLFSKAKVNTLSEISSRFMNSFFFQLDRKWIVRDVKYVWQL